MGEDDLWQESFAGRLSTLLRADTEVTALALYGSTARGACDAWSDVDALVVVLDGGVLARYFPSLNWLRPLGEVYAFEQNSNPLASTQRVCFADFNRADTVFTTEAGLALIDEWGAVSFWAGARVAFSRSAAVSRTLARRFPRPSPPALTHARLTELANDFRFRAGQAVVRVVRRDLTVALHLALGLMRDCCVLALHLRDGDEAAAAARVVTDERASPEGGGRIGVDDSLARLLSPALTADAAGLLDTVERCCHAFDDLAARLSADYEAGSRPLLDAVARARAEVAGV